MASTRSKKKKHTSKQAAPTATSAAAVPLDAETTQSILAAVINTIEAKKTPSTVPVAQSAKVKKFVEMSEKYFLQDFTSIEDLFEHCGDQKDIFFILVHAAAFCTQGMSAVTFSRLEQER